jgi:hypothetical protein
MPPISKKGYFKKSRTKAIGKLKFCWEVFEILNPKHYRFKKTGSVIRIFKGNEDHGFNKCVHVFVETNTHIHDKSCKGNCKYLWASAIKYRWLAMSRGTLALTKWQEMDQFTSWRLEVLRNTIKLRIRNKYGSILFGHERISLPDGFSRRVPLLQKLIDVGNSRWLNLRQFRGANISRETKRTLSNAI